MMYTKGEYVFVFNFHPERSFEGYYVPVGEEGEYRVVLSSDDEKFGGFGRVDRNAVYTATRTDADWVGFPCYLPSRSAIVLKLTKKKEAPTIKKVRRSIIRKVKK